MSSLVLTPPADGATDEPLTILLPSTGVSTDICAGVTPRAAS